jgi:hypothetical protein
MSYLVTYRYFDANDVDDSFARPLMFSKDRAACVNAIVRLIRKELKEGDACAGACADDFAFDATAYVVEAQPVPMLLSDGEDEDEDEDEEKMFAAVPGADAFIHVQSYAADARARGDFAADHETVYTIWRYLADSH